MHLHHSYSLCSVVDKSCSHCLHFSCYELQLFFDIMHMHNCLEETHSSAEDCFFPVSSPVVFALLQLLNSKCVRTK